MFTSVECRVYEATVLVQPSYTGLLQYICREAIDYIFGVNPQPCFKVSRGVS